MPNIDQEKAYELLERNADKIYHLIHNQRSHLCLAQCPAFEEVVDTQLYGFSKQVEFAVEVGIISMDEGHRLMSDLEYALNKVYTEIYEESKSKR